MRMMILMIKSLKLKAMTREQIIEILESDYNIDNIENVGDIADAILALKPIEQPYIPLDQYGYPLTTANNQTEVKRVEEKPTDEDIVASIPYPNPISKHQSDINIGWVRCRKAMRDNPEQFKSK